MDDRFVIWCFDDVEDAYVPDELSDSADDMFDVLEVLTAEDIKNDLKFTVDADYPEYNIFPDSLGNTECVIPISPKLKEFLERKNIPNLLFIPVELLNHNERVIKNYFLLHSIEEIDVIDKEKTTILRVDSLNEDMYDKVQDLVLLNHRVSSDIQIFRVKGLYDVTCVTRELANEIKECGFSGIYWKDISTYRY
ncbi:MAG: hypothetical protein COA79_12590 [Planctomycetota bacterium]|nr:MAG: hypothetical protein COA79_12590 [Planctomycetota bacterium]